MTPKKTTFQFGPGLIVAAAFIGPGTVLTASKAGAMYGYSLLWTVLFSVVAAIILQEMAARLGIVTGAGLSQAIRSSFESATVRRAMLLLVLVAILFGNAAYQTGNILGASIGLEVLTQHDVGIWIYAIAITALVVVWIGRFDVLQALLTLLVFIMSCLFIAAAVACGPDLFKIAKSLVIPSIQPGSEWFVIALIGTTVVPYNLFLHANAAAKKWAVDKTDAKDVTDLQRSAVRFSLLDTILSVFIGGVITAAILVTAAVAFGDTEAQLNNVKDIALQLRPTLGQWAETMFAVGLFAAGLTSAITAPIAAGYATAGCFGWPAELSDWRLKATATLVVIAGAVCGVLFGNSPKEAIITAQVANGLLLPIIAAFLLVAVNREKLMGPFRNRINRNILGGIVVMVTLLIAARQFNSVLSSFL